MVEMELNELSSSTEETQSSIASELKETKIAVCPAKISLVLATTFLKLITKIEDEMPLEESDDLSLLVAVYNVIGDYRLVKIIFPLVKSSDLIESRIPQWTADILDKKKKIFSDERMRLIKEQHERERERFGRLLVREPNCHWLRLSFIEAWYYLREDEAYQHLKYDDYLSTRDSIKADSKLDVIDTIDIEEFKKVLPEPLIRGGVLRRIYRLRWLAEDEPYARYIKDLLLKIFCIDEGEEEPPSELEEIARFLRPDSPVPSTKLCRYILRDSPNTSRGEILKELIRRQNGNIKS